METLTDEEHKRGERRRKLVVAAVLLTATALFGAAVLWGTAMSLPLPERLRDRHSTVVEYGNGLPAHVFLSEDERWRIGVSLDDVDPAYVDALVRFEDKRFHSHWGVDPIAVLRAAWLNVTFGRRMSGASTLTMQLVRVLEPRERTYVSKAIEAFRAWQIELRMDKDEILAAYLTYAPYGRNIEGVDAAALAYFGHRAREMSPTEIATLLAVPQNPNIRYPAPRNLERLRMSRNDIAQWLLDENVMPLGRDEGRVDPKTLWAQVKAAPVPRHLRPYPREIPHVAYWLRAMHPDRDRFQTTIDPGIQLTAERTLANHRDDAYASGVENAAAVVLDKQTGEVRALVGNFDFWSDRGGAQMPAFDLPRSPGSLLKPLLFAMATDRGATHPRHLVFDTPFEAGTYSPSNYDGTFRGLVRLDESLSKSLNIPFIRLLQQLGVSQFIGTLRTMDAAHLDEDPGFYGLSAAIGGVELTPLEVAGIYAMLGGDGAYRPVRLLRGQGRSTADGPRRSPVDVELRSEGGSDAAQIPMISPGAAWLTRKALRKRDRPGFHLRRVNPGAVKIWWKTGTSYGHRDAWAAGGGPHFVTVVWMGNLNNASSAALVGADRSGPVLFDILEGIEFREGGRSDPRPDDLARYEVCAYSGHLPTDACGATETVYGPLSNVPTDRCPYHVRVDVDDETGLALLPACRADREYTPTSFIRWPASVRRYMSDRSRAGPGIPALDPACGAHASTKPPTILSPPHDRTIVLVDGVAESDQEIPFEAEAEFAGVELSWFVNGKFVGTATADGRVWWEPSRGEHTVVVMDSAGHAAKRRVLVR